MKAVPVHRGILVAGALLLWTMLTVLLNREALLGEQTVFGETKLVRRGPPLHAGAAASQQRLAGSIPDLQMRVRRLNEKGNSWLNREQSQPSDVSLDSAYFYFSASAAAQPRQTEAHAALGQILSRRGEFPGAADHYRAALDHDSSNAMALYNLGLLLFSELAQRDSAAVVLAKAIERAPGLPVCNYILGYTALQRNDADAARELFTREINLFESTVRQNEIPVDSSAVHFAASESHFHLAVLHSTSFVDAARAQAHYNAFVGMVADPQRRAKALSEMQKYWDFGKSKADGGPHGP